MSDAARGLDHRHRHRICLGESPKRIGRRWPKPSSADTDALPPYVVHRVVPLDLDKQIPKKGDQRQMEHGSASGRTRPVSRSTARASRATQNSCRAWT